MRTWEYEEIQPGAGGVIVDPRCPTCSRFCSGKGTIVIYLGDEGVKRFEGWSCRRCGPFEPSILGWTGDFT